MQRGLGAVTDNMRDFDAEVHSSMGHGDTLRG